METVYTKVIISGYLLGLQKITLAALRGSYSPFDIRGRVAASLVVCTRFRTTVGDDLDFAGVEFFFDEEELVDWERVDETWLYE